MIGCKKCTSYLGKCPHCHTPRPFKPDGEVEMMSVAEANESAQGLAPHFPHTGRPEVEAERKCRSEGCHNYIHFQDVHRLISACTRCGDVVVSQVPTYEPPVKNCPVCNTNVNEDGV